MLYALSETNEKILAISGGKAYCPCCNSEMISKCGTLVIHHWAHKSTKDCDLWSEGETDWHLRWKSLFPKERTEVVIMKESIYHRADAVGRNGTVIEFQHSPITPRMINDREDFYKNMIWVFDVSSRGLDFERVDGKHFKRDMPIYSKKENGVLFRWKHSRPSYYHCTKDLYLDVSDKYLISVEWLFGTGYGCGIFVSKPDFVTEHGGNQSPYGVEFSRQ